MDLGQTSERRNDDARDARNKGDSGSPLFWSPAYQSRVARIRGTGIAPKPPSRYASMQKSPSAAFIVEVEEFARLDFPSLDLESQELVRVELLDLLREAGSYELDAGLAADLVWPENSVYLKQREIIPGVVDNEMIRCQRAWTRSASC